LVLVCGHVVALITVILCVNHHVTPGRQVLLLVVVILTTTVIPLVVGSPRRKLLTRIVMVVVSVAIHGNAREAVVSMMLEHVVILRVIRKTVGTTAAAREARASHAHVVGGPTTTRGAIVVERVRK
jgi:hypothetical protein